MEESEGQNEKKPHRKRLAGRKFDKKKAKNPHEQELTAKQRNPKAFAIHSAVKAERKFRRTMDLKAKKQHIPLVDHTPLDPPPYIVAVVGPPKVGKTTLIRALIKNFSRQNLADIKGPITVVSGKKKRITLLECCNDVNVMVDVAKVADLVLLLVDASYGFEMEIFEFLNVCQVHGFPRVLGVLTHLDALKDNKKLRKTKKTLKHRFWTEIYAGAKLFYLSGMIHGEYPKNEIHNLGRYVSVMKYRPLQWRTNHPYLLADRVEDLTDPEKLRQNPKCNRTVCVYGYARGAFFKNNSSVHIFGCGDHVIKDLSFLPDPCPLPEKLKKRSLIEKERLLYAPMAGVGGVLYDKDAVYIDLGGSHAHDTDANVDAEKEAVGELVSSLIDTHHTLDEKMSTSTLQIFKGAAPITAKDVEKDQAATFPRCTIEDVGGGRTRKRVIFEDEVEDDDSNSEESGDEPMEDSDVESSSEDEEISIADPKMKISYNEDNGSNNDAKQNELQFDDDDDDSENDSEEEGTLKWKEDLPKKAADAFYRRQQDTPNLRRLIYGDAVRKDASDEDDDEILGGLLKIASKANKSAKADKDFVNGLDCSKFKSATLQDWDNMDVFESIKDCFVTGKWEDDKDAQKLLQEADDDEDDEMYGDFEDLETGVKMNADTIPAKKPDEENETEDVDSKEAKVEKTSREKRLEKKMKLKQLFNSEYDDAEGATSYYDELKSEMNVQSELNKNEFVNMEDDVRVQYEGFRAGMYLRVELDDIPCEFITNFDPHYPVILGGLLAGEENIGFVQVRLKKHRWYNRILKTRDPLIISLGWRRFQTMPLYSIQDHNGRNRHLKYTPQHLHCVASFWGPITPQGTGMLAFQNVADVTANFRVAATGVVLDLDKSTQIMKKLKLTGDPFKIFKKTAFIRGMFNSSLEVSKFEGVAIRTVSGIRGEIKKAIRAPEGAFRATFEDKIKLSDIVFVRTWFNVAVPQFYIPVTSLLLPPEEKASWRGMRTVGQLRRDLNLPIPVNPDSVYRDVKRKEPIDEKPMKIPKTLQSMLPYTDKPKLLRQRKVAASQQRVAVIREPKERQVAKLMTMMRAVYNEKQRKQAVDAKTRNQLHMKKVKALEEQQLRRKKITRDRMCRVLGKKEQKRMKKRGD